MRFPGSETRDFVTISAQSATVLDRYADQPVAPGQDPRARWASPTTFAPAKIGPQTVASVAGLTRDIGADLARYKELRNVPPDMTRNFRNDMYLTGEALRLMEKTKQPTFRPDDLATLKNYHHHIDKSTKFIPMWVKVAVAIALGLGTMIGWKRIVVTVGERIGKEHLTSTALRCRRRDHRHGDHRGSRTYWAYLSAPHTFYLPASPARWPPTAPDCSFRRCEIF